MTRARILADYVSSGDELALKAPLISPALVTPNLGTPSAGTMTNVTGIPAAQVGGVLPVGVTGGSGLGNGITSIQTWYLSTQHYGTANNWLGKTTAPVTQSLSNGIGTMTVDTSDGKWSFPATGYWYVNWNANMQMLAGVSDSGSSWIVSQIFSDAGSTRLSEAYTQIGNNGSASTYAQTSISFIYDVTSTSTSVLYFKTVAGLTTYWWAGVDNQYVNFIRLGDT